MLMAAWTREQKRNWGAVALSHISETVFMGHCDGVDFKKMGVLGQTVFPKSLCATVLTPSISEHDLTWK